MILTIKGWCLKASQRDTSDQIPQKFIKSNTPPNKNNKQHPQITQKTQKQQINNTKFSANLPPTPPPKNKTHPCLYKTSPSLGQLRCASSETMSVDQNNLLIIIFNFSLNHEIIELFMNIRIRITFRLQTNKTLCILVLLSILKDTPWMCRKTSIQKTESPVKGFFKKPLQREPKEKERKNLWKAAKSLLIYAE